VRGLADQPQLALEQVPLLPADHARPEVPQLTQRGGVEGAGLRAVDAEATQAGAHLAGGARRERHREDLTGGDVPRLDEVRDAVHDRAGLAGAGAGEYADGAAWRVDGGELFGVEAGGVLSVGNVHNS
jgi:hypothetical protein